jgi:hypothetical protein
MRRLVLGFSLLTLCACHGTRGAESPATVLPLRTIRLYETGVGYFERAGTLTNGGESLPVPASHVDDALKTMIVLGDGGSAAVSAVEFESVLSRGLARSLAALPLGSEAPITYRNVLESLKGVEVMLATDREELVGKLVEVVEVSEAPSGPSGTASKSASDNTSDTRDDLYLTLLLRDGAVRRFRTSHLTSVRPTDATLAARLSSAVGALSDRAAQMHRGLRLLANAKGPIRLGYIAETPIWRSTYRLVLAPEGNTARLQGWALIHNDTDEAWSKVKLELVNGRPDSFLFPLTAPRYGRRPLASPEEEMSTVPQLADKTPDQVWGDHLDEGEAGGGSGFGYGHGSLGGSHVTRAPSVRMGMTSVSVGESDSIQIGNLAQVAQATGVEAGALYDYTLAHALELRPHGSALVPFTEEALQTRRITWFDVGDQQGHSAARLVNTSRQTLPTGPVAVYEPTGFAGETGLPRLKPHERTFLRFGIDLDVKLDRGAEKSDERVQHVGFESGSLMVHFVRHHEQKYELENRSLSPRVVYLALDIVNNATLHGTDETDFDDDVKKPLAVFLLGSGKKQEREIVTDEGLERTTPIADLTAASLRKLVEVAALPETERSILQSSAALLDQVEKSTKEKSAADSDVVRLSEDLERMRQHLQALGDKSGSPAGANPLVTRILALEDRRASARQKAEQHEEARQRQVEAVTAELGKLSKAKAG